MRFYLYGFLFLAPLAWSLGEETLRFEEAKKAFEQGKCEKVVEALKGFNYVPYLKDEGQFEQGYKWLVICYAKTKEIEKAKAELRNLLILNPNTQMDLFQTPPFVLQLLEEVRMSMKEQLMDIEKARQPPQLKPKVLSPLLLWLPFGMPQLVLEQPQKAMTLGLLQAGFLTFNVSAFWWKQIYIVPHTSNWVSNTQDATWFFIAQTAQWVFLGLFLGTYTYSVWDAWMDR